MDKTKRIRVARRVVAMSLLALFLAVVSPMLIGDTVRETFFLTDIAQSIAERYQQTLFWCHVGGMVLSLVLNLTYFFANESRGDSGFVLRRRTAQQNWLNFLLILLTVLTMVALRYVITAERLIDVYVSGAPAYVAWLVSPYGVYLVSALLFWVFCMRAVPATNKPVLSALWKKSDDDLKRAAKTRK